MCLLENSKIITLDGYKDIQRIKFNDYVLTREGRYQQASEIHFREYKGNIIKIKINGLFKTMDVTPDHLFYAFRGNKLDRSEDNFKLMSSTDLKIGDYLIYPIEVPKWEHITLDSDKHLAKFLGYYVLEGFLDHERKKVIIHLDKIKNYKDDLINCITNLYGEDNMQYEYMNEKFISINNELAYTTCLKFGDKNINKNIDESLFRFSDDVLLEFIKPFFNISKIDNRNNTFRPATSLDLLLGYQRILFRLRCFANLYECHGKEENFKYYALLINSKERANLTNPNKDTWFIKDNYAYLKIEDIQEEFYDGYVYNIITDKDNSFCSHIITNFNN